jgi:hypothetical protein
MGELFHSIFNGWSLKMYCIFSVNANQCCEAKTLNEELLSRLSKNNGVINRG